MLRDVDLIPVDESLPELPVEPIRFAEDQHDRLLRANHLEQRWPKVRIRIVARGRAIGIIYNNGRAVRPERRQQRPHQQTIVGLQADEPRQGFRICQLPHVLAPDTLQLST